MHDHHGVHNSDFVIPLQSGQIQSPPIPLTSAVFAHGTNPWPMRLPGLAVDAASPNNTVPATWPIKAEAKDETLVIPAAASHASLPAHPSFIPRSPPFPHHRGSPSDMQSPTKALQIFNLLRDLSYTRREISIAQERERQLQKDIEKLGDSGMSQSLQETKESHHERNCQVDTELQLQAVQLKLEVEQNKRAIAEQSLKDVERECKEPFVVPALLKAFIKISQLSSAAVDEVNKVQSVR
ncbi:hypothetical protein PILCRDRAFT_829050 [Piloderma croceum F 1598]|uniref:Uncharacterized protein n=1 Tax=Piloderma croceum (strain F 1598) TaxID=765440 RepID=A0A0C3F0U1_PILCF|nr:hypothetical protein PILCRDRAFT_829050 [Piloderma croceum F 1598]